MNQTSLKKSVILSGPTAVGKSDLALEFALEFASTHGHQIEIINADSVCFYQEFNIGSAKPSEQDLKKVRHHLIDVAHPHEQYHAGKFLKDTEAALKDIHARGNRALIVGGSGFYLKALRYGLWEAPPTSTEFRESFKDQSLNELYQRLQAIDPLHAEKVKPQDRYRLIRALEIHHLSGKKPSELESQMPKIADERFELWILDRDQEALAFRMKARVKEMIEKGLIDEVIQLRDRYPLSKTLHAVGYQQVLDFLNGVQPKGRQPKPGIKGLMEEIELAHRQLAKQQRTWFKNLNPHENFALDQDGFLLKEKLMKRYQ